MTPIVIGISGKIGAGKDAIAEHLVKKYRFQVVRFSDPLKQEILDTLPKTLKQIYRQLYQGAEPDDYALRRMLWHTKPPIVRELLQEWGTELRRAEDPDYWVKKWNQTVYDKTLGGVSVVAPDMRFDNEVGAVWDFSGYTIKVTRPGTVMGTHRSEKELDGRDDFNFSVDNNGTLEDLYLMVDEFIPKIL